MSTSSTTSKPPTSLPNKTPITDINEDNNTREKLHPILTPREAESIVESLQPFPVEEIGSSEFLQTYAFHLERLSLQAHASAQEGAEDEFVTEAIVTFGKLDVLVRTLLAIEAWRTFLLVPRGSGSKGVEDGGGSSSLSSSSVLLGLVAENGNSLRVAFTLHVETTLVGILNLVMYRRERCEAMTSEAAIALCDYCARQIVSSERLFCFTALAVLSFVIWFMFHVCVFCVFCVFCLQVCCPFSISTSTSTSTQL